MNKLLLGVALLLSIVANAQVTIGSGNEPLKGALLDLKEYEPKADNTTATKGLGLPRMKLVALDELTVAGADKKEEHTGLAVYNLNQCDGLSAGLYVWDGAKWQQISDGAPATTPKITFIPYTLFFTSGHPNDKPIETKSFQVHWKPSDATITSLAPSTAIKWQTPVAPIGVLSDNPTTFASLTPLPMEAKYLDVRAPKVLTSSMRFTKKNSCGVNAGQENYAMYQVKRGFTANAVKQLLVSAEPITGELLPVLRFQLDGKKEKGLITVANTKWEAKGINNTLLTSISATHNGANTISLMGGKEIESSQFQEDSLYYSTTTNNAIAKYSYYDNVLTFSDKQTPKRFEDLSVSAVVCTGPIASNATVALSPEVSRHQDQDQNWFLARKFGTAGTWMLQDMRAKKFDPIRDDGEVVSKAVVGCVIPWGEDFPIWLYPNVEGSNDLTDSSVFDADPRLGLLYNWAAATNSKTIADNDKPRRQGICPSGWHFPYRNEWDALEAEIKANPSLYTYSARIIDRTMPFALQDICAEQKLSTATNPNLGLSKPMHQGGFSMLFPGQWTQSTAIEIPRASGLGEITKVLFNSLYVIGSGGQTHFNIKDYFVDGSVWVGQNGIGVRGVVRCRKNVD